jgi:pimeloyl-ACP methyl ester carboxylesterase
MLSIKLTPVSEFRNDADPFPREIIVQVAIPFFVAIICDPLFLMNCTPNLETSLYIHSYNNSKTEWYSIFYCIERLKGNFESVNETIGPQAMSSLDNCLEFLANLITSKAANGIAHVIGLSVGAHIAVHLAQRYPQLVETLIISGLTQFPAIIQPSLPILFYLLSHLWDGPRLTSLHRQPFLFRIFFFCKTGDNPKIAKKMQGILNNTQLEVKVKGGKRLKHRWNVGHPMLFAKLIVNWIDNSWSEELNVEFEDL